MIRISGQPVSLYDTQPWGICSTQELPPCGQCTLIANIPWTLPPASWPPPMVPISPDKEGQLSNLRGSPHWPVNLPWPLPPASHPPPIGPLWPVGTRPRPAVRNPPRGSGLPGRRPGRGTPSHFMHHSVHWAASFKIKVLNMGTVYLCLIFPSKIDLPKATQVKQHQ